MISCTQSSGSTDSTKDNNDMGPVVQSIVSLTKSLVDDSLSLLVRLKSSVLIFFAEKM